MNAARVFVPAIIAIVPLIAATWILPPDFPMLLRQLVLCAWGVGSTLVAERLLFSNSLGSAVRAMGFVPARRRALVVASLVSVPMWLFLPLFARANGIPPVLQPGWPALLLGVVLVNGVTEEVIHRSFVFGHLRRGRSFAGAATLSGTLFAAQHLYLVVTIGWMAGLASVLLAALLAFPFSYVFERGGNSIGAPAILHTSSNAPMIVLALPGSFVATAMLPHMAVVLMSLYLVFLLRNFFDAPSTGRAGASPRRR